MNEINGVICINKPQDFTSFDVVAIMRRAAGTRKIGHGGTLDPMATGVLPIYIGRAAKTADLNPVSDKRYRATFRLGVTTDTEDVWGKVLTKSEKPVTLAEITDAVKTMQGDIMQIPPMYSAIKKDGQKLYQLARQGIEVEREARSITIDALELLHQTDTSLTLDIVCSKGTYIRTLLEDIAAELGMCGTMSFLLRKQVGDFYLAEAKTLEEIAAAPAAYLLPAETAVQDLQELVLTDKQALRITQGVKTTVRGIADGTYRLKTVTGDFLGIGSAESELVKAEKILKQFQADAELL
jgi:tRNA pseudouridine55 synthase